MQIEFLNGLFIELDYQLDNIVYFFLADKIYYYNEHCQLIVKKLGFTKRIHDKNVHFDNAEKNLNNERKIVLEDVK